MANQIVKLSYKWFWSSTETNDGANGRYHYAGIHYSIKKNLSQSVVAFRKVKK